MTPATTIPEMLARLADMPRERGLTIVSARFESRHVPWSELLARVLEQAEALSAQGVGPGDRVVVPLSTDLPLITAFLGVIWIGATPVSVGGQMAGQSRDAWLRRLKDLRARHDFQHAAFDAVTREVALDGGFPRELVLDLLPGEEAPAPPSIWPAARVVSPDDSAFVQFSSGSTSAPKGVVITHRNACANLALIVEHDGRGPTSPIVMWVPLSHDMGLVGGL